MPNTSPQRSASGSALTSMPRRPSSPASSSEHRISATAAASIPVITVHDYDRASTSTAPVLKKPRVNSGTPLRLSLASTDSVCCTLNETWNAKVLQKLRATEGVKTLSSGMIGVKKVVLPIDKLHELSSLLQMQHSTYFEFDFPKILLERLQKRKDEHRRREESGDIVTRPLNDILPMSICESLMDFQWEGVHFALQRGGKCLIGDDMGLGKTLQAITVARIYAEDWPLLIVCPSSLRLNWKEELLRWLVDDLAERDINLIMKGTDCERSFKRVNIVSYDLMRKVRQRNLDRVGFIIADESHYLKSAQAKRSQVVIPIVSRCRRALLLSGTPALSRPVELFPQISALCPTLFPSYNEYTERYCNAHVGRFGYDVSGSSNLTELHMLLCGSVLIRRKKDDVLTQLPSKRRQVLWVETKPKVMKDVKATFAEYEKAQAAANAASGDQAHELRNIVRGIQNKLYSLSASAKLDAVQEFVKETAETGVKFIVFVHHGEIMDALDTFVGKKLKLGLIRIDGNTQQSLRQGLCKKFQEHPDCRVALLSITAAGVGLTLTAATVVLFAELYWNPGSLMQAEDRAHRIGQRDCVFVKYLLAKGTLDETMWGTIRRKFNVIGKSLTGSADVLDINSEKDKVDKDEKKNAGKKEKSRFFHFESDLSQTPTQSKTQCTPLTVSSPQPRRIRDAEVVCISPDDEDFRQQDVICLDDSSPNLDEMFPSSNSPFKEIARPRSSKQTNRTRKPNLDADLAFARRLQAQFNAEQRRQI